MFYWCSLHIKPMHTLKMSIFQSEITPLLRSISNRPVSGSSVWVKTLKLRRIMTRQLKPGCACTSGGMSAGTASVVVLSTVMQLLLLLILLLPAWTSGDIKSMMTFVCSTEIRAAQNCIKSLNGRRHTPSRTADTWAHLPVSCYNTNGQLSTFTNCLQTILKTSGLSRTPKLPLLCFPFVEAANFQPLQKSPWKTFGM